MEQTLTVQGVTAGHLCGCIFTVIVNHDNANLEGLIGQIIQQLRQTRCLIPGWNQNGEWGGIGKVWVRGLTGCESPSTSPSEQYDRMTD